MSRSGFARRTETLVRKGVPRKIADRIECAFGAKLRLQITVGQANGLSLAAHEAQQRSAEQSAAERAVENDPFVRSLREDFGAQIVPDSVRPIIKH